MSDYLPHELIHEILIRLPVKSLLHFTTVCKSWHSLITNPSFATAHRNQAIARNGKDPETLLFRYYDRNERQEHYILCCDDDENFGEQLVEIEFPFKSEIGYLVGSCDGILCLSGDLFCNSENIVLWNPSIRKCLTVQMPATPKYPLMFVLGFGVCPVTNEAKVVRILYLRDLSCTGSESPPEVEIYALSTGTWRSADCPAPSSLMIDFTWKQAFVNGAVHWAASCRRVEVDFRSLIVSFDMVDEVFHEMMLPHALVGEDVMNLSIAVLGGSLSILSYSEEDWTTSCSVWVMKAYGTAESWSKLFTVDLLGRLKKQVGFRKNGEVILVMRNSELATYDPKNGQTKCLGIFGNIGSFSVDTYMETLYLLNGDATDVS